MTRDLAALVRDYFGPCFWCSSICRKCSKIKIDSAQRLTIISQSSDSQCPYILRLGDVLLQSSDAIYNMRSDLVLKEFIIVTANEWQVEPDRGSNKKAFSREAKMNCAVIAWASGMRFTLKKIGIRISCSAKQWLSCFEGCAAVIRVQRDDWGSRAVWGLNLATVYRY